MARKGTDMSPTWPERQGGDKEASQARREGLRRGTCRRRGEGKAEWGPGCEGHGRMPSSLTAGDFRSPLHNYLSSLSQAHVGQPTAHEKS